MPALCYLKQKSGQRVWVLTGAGGRWLNTGKSTVGLCCPVLKTKGCGPKPPKGEKKTDCPPKGRNPGPPKGENRGLPKGINPGLPTGENMPLPNKGTLPPDRKSTRLN